MSPRDIPYTREASAVSLHETFVTNVRRLMVEKGWTKSAGTLAQGIPGNTRIDLIRLAEASGIPHRTVENLMTLNNQPTMVGAAKIAQALGTSLDTLLGQEDIFTAPSISRSSELACIHSRAHLPGKFVCEPCLSKWQSYQRRLRELYERRHSGNRGEWDTENREVRKAQTGNLPEDEKENMG